jgi:MoxR-like ATPase
LELYVWAEERITITKELNRQLFAEDSLIRASVDIVDYGEILRYIDIDTENNLAFLDISDYSDSIEILPETAKIISLFQTKSINEIKGIANSFLTEDFIKVLMQRRKDGLESASIGVPGINDSPVPESPSMVQSTGAINAPQIQTAPTQFTTSPLQTASALESYVRQVREAIGWKIITEEDCQKLLLEDDLPGIAKADRPTMSGGQIDKTETYLRAYLTKLYPTARQVPTLIGPTAVAKSAVVKKLAKELDLRFIDFRCLHGDTQIKLLDGTSKKIKDIPTGEQVWVYSCEKDGRIVPSLATALGVTREKASFVEVEIDSGEKIRVTPDHKFILRDGSEVEAKDLVPNTSLMPIYTKQEKIRSSGSSLYELVLDNRSGEYVFTHRLVASTFYDYPRLGYVAHHVNLNSLDNRPENLQVILDEVHIELHGDIVKRAWDDPVLAAQRREEISRVSRERWANPEFKKKMQPHLDMLHESPFRKKRLAHVMSQISKDLWSDPEYRGRQIERLHEDWTTERRELQSEQTRRQAISQWSDPEYRDRRRSTFFSKSREIVIALVKQMASLGIAVNRDSYEVYRKQHNDGKSAHSCAPNYYSMKRKGFTLESVVDSVKNHKVVSVRAVNEVSDAYCLNVPGNENFALSCGIFVHNCAFIERADIEGMKKYTIDPDTGSYLSYSASMDKIITATDDFMEFSTAKYDEVVEYIRDTPNIPPDELKTLEKIRDKFAEWKKPALLFFDEVNRAPASVMSAFTSILNQKLYKIHKMTQCRMVCAANAPINLGKDIAEVYLVGDESTDVAKSQRFQPLPVYPQDIFPRWRDFVKSAGWHKSIIDFVGDDTEKAYAIKVLNEIGTEAKGRGAIQEAALVPFPNYRTWEYVNNHVTAVEANRCTYNEEHIKKVIGDNEVSQEYLDFLKKNYPGIVSNIGTASGKVDDFTKGIESSIRSSIPMMMIAPTSYGKTYRVKKVCKEMGVGEPLCINLAEKDRIDVMGTPKTVNIIDYTMQEAKLPDGHPLLDKLKDTSAIAKFNLPADISVFAPDSVFRQRIKQLKPGQKLVVFFDELNRSQETTMSAVFEAISDNRLFGVNFQPGQICVLAAMNHGKAYADVKEIDAAFSARFAMYWKKSLDVGDVEDVRNQQKSEGYSPIIQDYLSSKSDDDLVDMFMSVEKDEIQFGKAAPTTRGWSELNKAIKYIDQPMYVGSTLDPDGSVASRFMQRLSQSKDDLVDELEVLYSLIPSNWAGYDAGVRPIAFNGVNFTPKKFVEAIRDTIDSIRSGKYDSDIPAISRNLHDSFMQIISLDNEVKIAREHMIFSKLGERFGQDFTVYYNQAMGRDSIDLKDVKDVPRAILYVKKVILLNPDPMKARDALEQDIVRHASLFPDRKIRQVLFDGVVSVFVDELRNEDFFYGLAGSAESNSALYAWFDSIFTDSVFAEKVMKKFGVTDPDMINNVFQYNQERGA